MLKKIVDKLTIRNKILLGVGLSVLIGMVILGGLILFEFKTFTDENVHNLRELLIKEKRQQIKSTVDVMAGTLSDIYDKQQGNLSKEELKELLVNEVNEAQFGENGYFYMYNYQGTVIAHGAKPQLINDNLWDLKRKDQYVIRDLAAAAEDGGGFVNFFWEHPETDKMEQKFGYAAPIEGTDWFIGSGAYESAINPKLEAESKKVQQTEGDILLSIFLVLAVELLLLGIIIFKISGYLEDNFDKLLTGFKELEDGNLNATVDIDSQDEIGELGRAFNEFAAEQSKLLTNILGVVDDLSAYSEELSASAQEGNAAIETTTQLIEEMSTNIQQISTSAQEVTGLAQEANSQTEIGSENIEQAVSSMKEINNAVEETVEVISNLDSKSEEIGKIVDLITNIAEQTNMLALNASIEAARAGEHGQGFAVVAEEIRELAEKTANATDEINDLVTETQQKSNVGLQSIKEVAAKAEKGLEIAEETGEVFAEINNASQQTSSNIQQTAAATQDLVENSDEIREAAEENDNVAREVANSSQELASMAQELKELIEEFEV